MYVEREMCVYTCIHVNIGAVLSLRHVMLYHNNNYDSLVYV